MSSLKTIKKHIVVKALRAQIEHHLAFAVFYWSITFFPLLVKAYHRWQQGHYKLTLQLLYTKPRDRQPNWLRQFVEKVEQSNCDHINKQIFVKKIVSVGEKNLFLLLFLTLAKYSATVTW